MLNPQSFQFLTRVKICRTDESQICVNLLSVLTDRQWMQWVALGFVCGDVITCVSTDVLNETSNALVGIVAVAALVLPIAGPLQAVQLHIRPFLRWHVDLHGRELAAVLPAFGGD